MLFNVLSISTVLSTPIKIVGYYKCFNNLLLYILGTQLRIVSLESGHDLFIYFFKYLFNEVILAICYVLTIKRFIIFPQLIFVKYLFTFFSFRKNKNILVCNEFQVDKVAQCLIYVELTVKQNIFIIDNNSVTCFFIITIRRVNYRLNLKIYKQATTNRAMICFSCLVNS